MTTALATYDPKLPADLAGLTREQLTELGRKVASVESVSRWALGDLACQVETTYGESELRSYADEIGVAWSTLRGYAQVSQAFPQSVPRGTHPWSVYRELAAQEDRAELTAREQPWTYAEAQELRWDRDRKETQRELRRQARERRKAKAAKAKPAKPAKVIAGKVEPAGDQAPEPASTEPATEPATEPTEPADTDELAELKAERDELARQLAEVTAERDQLAADLAELKKHLKVK